MRPIVTASAVAICLVFGSLGASAAEVTWPEKFYDPAPAADHERTIPLPCGGAITLVRIDVLVPPDKPLADRKVKLGSGDLNTGYLDYYRTAFLRGGFSGHGRTYYWLGKYEVTRDQYRAVMADECPEPSRGGMRPANDLSWFEALEFTRKLTEWARANAAESLPKEHGATGFFRLPTEVEWEYAIRGGSAVDVTDFRAMLFPMESDITDYAWFAGRRSANGSLRPIGMHKPNPLDLYGMLGGVAEIMLGPFHLNSLGRPGGQVGGFVTRGGSIETTKAELRSSLRSENPYFNRRTGEAYSDDSFGIRVVLSTMINTSLPRTNLIRKRWLDAASAPADTINDPLALLDSMVERETVKQVKQQLRVVRGAVLAAQHAREQAAQRASTLSIYNGAILLGWLQAVSSNVTQLETVVDIISDNLGKGFTRDQLDKQHEKLAKLKRRFDMAAAGYLTTLTRIGDKLEPETARTLSQRLATALKARGEGNLIPYVKRFVKAIAYRAGNPGASRQDLIDFAVQ